MSRVLSSTAVARRLAGAPISWGVCEVPGWGWQAPPERVLGQMRELGLAATEFGPDGYLPTDPRERSRLLSRFDLAPVGQFAPIVLHRSRHDPLSEAMAVLDELAASGARVLVLAAATGGAGYERPPALDSGGWQILLANLDRIAAVAQERGLLATLHPHVGTMIESVRDAERVLDGSTIDLTLDTGHLLVGGGDPADLVRSRARRVAHVHLKDVRGDLAAKVRDGDLTYADAVRAGLYVPLGQGGVDVAGIVRGLEDAGFEGWYVLEQDLAIDEDPWETGGSDPIDGVRASIDYLRALESATQPDDGTPATGAARVEREATS